uniref:lipoyl(octanoyl) transferase n=1 Tax=Trypanosoma congolense (strain IL3000) TaxID=1068625 RepID=G0V1J2_TRYCI|nr:unnamed protein product [Trypanosoma congolense IL3000]
MECMQAYFLGSRCYHDVLKLQQSIFEKKIARQMARLRGDLTSRPVPDTVLLVEHSSPVYTIGRRDTSCGIRAGCAAEVVKTRRGGGVTFHGPGQVTMYPIVNVQLLWKHCTAPNKPRSPIEWFSFVLEQAMINVARDYNIPAHRGRIGVWSDKWGAVAPRKMGFVGLQLANWVSMHGAGLNVCNDLRYFDDIVMCEMPEERATSLVDEIRLRGLNVAEPTPRNVGPLLLHHFLFNLHQENSVVSTKLVDLSTDDNWEQSSLREVE